MLTQRNLRTAVMLNSAEIGTHLGVDDAEIIPTALTRLNELTDQPTQQQTRPIMSDISWRR